MKKLSNQTLKMGAHLFNDVEVRSVVKEEWPRLIDTVESGMVYFDKENRHFTMVYRLKVSDPWRPLAGGPRNLHHAA